jgi:integrase
VLLALESAADEEPHLFASRAVKGAPVTAHALAVAMARFAANADLEAAKSWQVEPPSPHDLRRTVATRLAELGIPKEDRDATLNHTPRDVGKKHYDLYDREREKRGALELWARTLSTIIENKKGNAAIVVLRRRRTRD